VIEFSPSALALHSLAQKLPVDQIAAQITPELITFCNNCPEQARTLAERQDFHQKSFRGINNDDGILLAYNDRNYEPGILDLIDQGLFEGDGRDGRIKNFLASSPVQHNFFYVDGIKRGNMPHITLPNGVEILSNSGDINSEYCKKMGKPFDQAQYLKYMLDQFKEAYKPTDEAIKAFKVFVQNFTGSGNTFGNICTKLVPDETVLRGIVPTIKWPLLGRMFKRHRSQSTMRMDECFNITLNITACISGRESIQQLNAQCEITHTPPFREDAIFGITISSHIPAEINDTMDQRGQRGQQTTTFEIIGSLGNGGSN
jgi:hypothetical protein